MSGIRAVAALAALTFVLAGCADVTPPGEATVNDSAALLDGTAPVVITEAMSFLESEVDAAYKFAADLYEPTMEVSPTGVIYVTGHTIGADTTGAPVFFSNDNGTSWAQLPFAGPAALQVMHGATPPPSDEIFLVAGDDGQLWGVDITLATFPVNGWCDDGGSLCYHNPNAYDEAEAMRARALVASGEGGSCSALNLNDRPWAAYGNGKLLMVNNPGGGPVQVGLMDVPPALPVGGPQLGVAGMAQWNLCAGDGGGSIPGIPDMRDDHFFAVPQVQGGKLVIVKGYGDVNAVDQVTVFNNTNTGGGTSNYGQVNFDKAGTMFIGIRNNTAEDAAGERIGQLHLAISQDDGTTFQERTFTTSAPTTSLYMDGYKQGKGALVTWGQTGAQGGTDWYAAHMQIGPDGGPILENASLVLASGPNPSAHVQGAAVSPFGFGMLVMDYGGSVGDKPLRVMIQEAGGARMPDLLEASAAIA